MLAALLGAAVVGGLRLVPAVGLAPQWPAPPEPERTAGWHRLSNLAVVLRQDDARRARGHRSEKGQR